MLAACQRPHAEHRNRPCVTDGRTADHRTASDYLGHLAHMPRAIRAPDDVHHRIDRPRDVLLHGGQRPVAHLVQHQRRESLERVQGTVGMHRRQ